MSNVMYFETTLIYFIGRINDFATLGVRKHTTLFSSLSQEKPVLDPVFKISEDKSRARNSIAIKDSVDQRRSEQKILMIPWNVQYLPTL